jgi:hypothetical protein
MKYSPETLSRFGAVLLLLGMQSVETGRLSFKG